MARNCEKQYGKLNRLILAKEKEEFDQKFPKRPKLCHLNTVEDIKHWLPSIKRDIDFNLKQSQVICYSESKIEEYRNNVTSLEHEYRRFVRKLKQLDGNIIDIPWTDRPYQPKHNVLTEETALQMPLSGQETRIETPLLRGSQTSDSDPVLVLNCHNETQDAPLNFKEILTKRIAKDNVGNSRHPQKRKYQFCDQQAYLSTELKLRRIFGLKPA